MKVVLGGSRKLGFIPDPVVTFLNDSIERGDNFFIGDAAGVDLKSKSNALHAFKDREMCKRADLGLMIWDQESAGTLSNAIDLLSQGKSCYIYNALDQEFVKFDTSNSLDKWLETYPEVAAEALSRLNRFRNRMKIGSKLDSVQSELF